MSYSSRVSAGNCLVRDWLLRLIWPISTFDFHIVKCFFSSYKKIVMTPLECLDLLYSLEKSGHTFLFDFFCCLGPCLSDELECIWISHSNFIESGFFSYSTIISTSKIWKLVIGDSIKSAELESHISAQTVIMRVWILFIDCYRVNLALINRTD